MPNFQDLQKRRWTVALTISTVKRIRDATGVDLLRVIDEPDLLKQLAADPIQLVDVLWVIVQPQAREQGVSDEQFGESLAGEEIEHATAAFLEALVDFFPGARRGTLRRALDRSNKALADQEKAIQAALDDGTIDKALENVFAGGKKSGESPAVPGSTPAS